MSTERLQELGLLPSDDDRIRRIVESVLTAQKKTPSVNGNGNGNGKGSMLKMVGVLVGLIIAVLAPTLTVTWSASERSTKLESVCQTVDELKQNLGAVQQELRSLREAIIRLAPDASFRPSRLLGSAAVPTMVGP